MSLTSPQQSTTFNAPTENNVTALTFDASVYSNGPLQISYPPYVEPMAGSQAFLESLSVIGVPMYASQRYLYDISMTDHFPQRSRA
jgi:hypothetical protein